MEINKEYIFEDKNDLVNYLLYKLNLPSQLKIQKTLYLLFAFYGATYGKLINEENNSELDSNNYTPFLFKPNFQAWKYGPVDYDVNYSLILYIQRIQYNHKNSLIDIILQGIKDNKNRR